MIRAVVIQLPGLAVRRGMPDRRVCTFDADDGRHTTTAAECGVVVGLGCPDPSAPHQYRPLPWWRRIRRRHSWEMFG